jgi:hypothetical protein
MFNVRLLHEYSMGLLDSLSVGYEAHYFPSGAIMLDIWHSDKFYVLQFEESFIGFSAIDDNTGFDALPDEKYYSEEVFKQKLEFLLK